jgi:hypothetical protein
MPLFQRRQPEQTLEQQLEQLQAVEAKREVLRSAVAKAEQVLGAAKAQSIPPAELERMDDMQVLSREANFKRQAARAERELGEAQEALQRFEQVNPQVQIADAMQRLLAAIAERNREEVRNRYRAKLSEILAAFDGLKNLATEADGIRADGKRNGLDLPDVLPRGLFATPNTNLPESVIVANSIRMLATKHDPTLGDEKSAVWAKRWREGPASGCLYFVSWC